ncbi:MAG TPA: universal stress protein, partial [Propionibacteriaceae bacterium]|nr:universal stress protein [Propionibacteriaceae bacterium]
MESSSSDNQTGDRIVVGIGSGGPDHYGAALGLAAYMSSHRDATITLVHGSLPRLSIATDAGHERHLVRGRELVEEARVALSALVDPRIHISVAVLPQTGVEALLHESQTAATLIVQRRRIATLSRAFRGTTSHTVAAQATCPVIVVRHDQSDHDQSDPDQSDPDQSHAGSRRGVVVGVAPHSGLLALGIGVAEAAARRCPLTAVYVWDLQFSPTYGGWIDPDNEELAEATKWADSFLASAVSEVARQHPDVEIRARSVRGVIEDGLLQECANAELLVVERHRDAHLASIGLGKLTRHLID